VYHKKIYSVISLQKFERHDVLRLKMAIKNLYDLIMTVGLEW